MAKRLGVSVVFCWGTVWEFWFHPDSDVNQNYKDLLSLINQEMRHIRGEGALADALPVERMAAIAMDALKDLNKTDE